MLFSTARWGFDDLKICLLLSQKDNNVIGDFVW
jgi:hypothetical protein